MVQYQSCCYFQTSLHRSLDIDHRKIALAVIVSFGQLLISYCFCRLLSRLHPFSRMDPLSSGSCGRLFQADLGRNVHPCNPAGRFHYASVIGLGHLCRHGRILDPASKSVVPAHSFPLPQYQVSSSACHGHIPSHTHINPYPILGMVIPL